jgi:Oxidoreductase family, NAD-binding Rossmann fold
MRTSLWKLAGMATVLASLASSADLRLGMIGTDTSHATEFTKILNDSSSPQHVSGARVIAAFKGGSKDMPESYKRVDKFAETLRTKYNVEFVPDIQSLCGKVDGILLESVDGRQHLEQVKQAVNCHKPLWIDKPLASSLSDAKAIATIVQQAGVPWFSASSLRFMPAAINLKSPDATNAIAWGPGPLGPGGLDLSWYAIHAVELLYTLMGEGCEEVSRTHTDASDVIVGRWRDGRVGEVRAIRPDSGYGAVVFKKKGTPSTLPDMDDSYQPLVAEIVKFFNTRTPPVSNDETIETFEFMDAAQRSMASNGAPVKLR